MSKRIQIYTEGGLYLGVGNVFRSLSLANKIKDKEKVEISFITSSEDYIKDIIIKQNFQVIVKNNQIDILDYIIQEKSNILIIDYLGINANFVKKIKEQNIYVIIVGNISEANSYADIVINAIIGTNFNNNIRTDVNGTLFFEGPKYLLLRSEFTQKRNSYKYRNSLKNVTLLFGGTDQANFSCKVLHNLTLYDNSLNITIILGPGYTFYEELDILIETKSLKNNVKILKNATNISEILLNSDFLITSPGTTLFEAFCLGVPALAFFQNKSQRDIFCSFFRTSAYEDFNNVSLKKHITSLYEDYDSYKKELNFLSIGTGENEIINKIVQVLKS
ncbi:MAG: hypothetical protein LBQ22_07435 [Bacteroidales bacterium]|jgi:spore coat polysaccharide biosynthesis predicted glycosyltransferase SpsG|nr:hypothetical protein [Bacteroidales bacterium]